MKLDKLIDQYLDSKGAVVKGASIAAKFPPGMSAPTDVTKLMRASFEKPESAPERAHAA
jgi:hypothetical protein